MTKIMFSQKRATYHVEQNTLLPVSPAQQADASALPLFDRWAIFALLIILCLIVAGAKGLL